MLQMELPSLTTRRLALVSFPVGMGMRVEGGHSNRVLAHYSVKNLIIICNVDSGDAALVHMEML